MTNALYIAWRSGEPTNGRWGPVGRLEHGPRGYRFVYTRGAQTMEGFRPFPDMPQLDSVYESEALFPLFANRLLSRSRPEYEAYLTWGGFDLADQPDPLAVLGVTEGMRQTDSFEVFPCPSPDAGGSYSMKFFLHGVRWMAREAIARIDTLEKGEKLGLMLDISNEYDSNAVAVRTSEASGRMLIGYVPRYLARDVRTLWVSCEPDSIEVAVERVNQGAPLQHRVLCRMIAFPSEGFQPCAGEEYQPMVAHLESMTCRE